MPTPIFTWTPSWGTAERSEPRTRNAELAQAAALGSDGTSADLKSWNVVLENRLHDEALAIDLFLASRGGVEVFEWDNPRSLIKFYICEQWDCVVVADRGRGDAATDRIWTVTATFREVALAGAGGTVRPPMPLPPPLLPPPLIGNFQSCQDIINTGGAGGAGSAVFHPSGDAIASTRREQPYVNVFGWNDDSRVLGPQYPNPVVLPEGSSFSNGFAVAFSPSGNTILVVGNFTERLAAYRWSNETGFGEKIACPTLPDYFGSPSISHSIDFSPQGDAIAFSIQPSPLAIVYRWNSDDTFGAPYSEPSDPPDTSESSFTPAPEFHTARFNPQGTAIVVTMQTAAVPDFSLVAFQWNSATGFGSRIPGFANGTGTVTAREVAFSPDGSVLIVVGGGSGASVAFMWAYPFSLAGIGAKYPDAPTGPFPEWRSYTLFSIKDIAFSPAGDMIAIAQSGDSFAYLYRWSNESGFISHQLAPCTTLNVGGVQFSPKSGALAVAGEAGSAGRLTVAPNSLWDIPFPTTPSGFSAQAQSGPIRVELSWSAVNEASSYKIERSTDNISYSLLSDVNAPLVTFVDNNTSPETLYWYRIASENLSGLSAFSAPVSATTPALPAIPSPALAIPASYSQSSIWPDNVAATEAGMQNGVFAELLETGTDFGNPAWVKMDFGSTQSFSSVIVGCDFDNTLAGDWTRFYTENCLVEGSLDDLDWTALFNTGTFARGIEVYATPGASYRYVRIRTPSFFQYLALTELYAVP